MKGTRVVEAMRVALRETGSILVSASEQDVMELLERLVDGHRTAPGRVEGLGGIYVVRPSANGTQVIHARRGEAGVAMATREREELRSAVASDLFAIQRLFSSR